MKKFLFYFLACIVFISCNDNTTPSGPPTPPADKYDIDLNASFAMGLYQNDPMGMNDGLSNFYVALSNVKIENVDGELVTTEVGDIVVIDIYALPTGNGILPEGTYRFLSEDEDIADKTFSDYTSYIETKIDGGINDVVIAQFTKGELTVAKSGSGYTVTLCGELVDARTLRVTYTGDIKLIEDVGSGDGEIFPPLTANVDATFIASDAVYYGDGRYLLQLFDYENDGYNHPGNILFIDMITALPTNGVNLLPGVYSIATESLIPGEADMQTLQNKGTNCLNVVMNGDDYIMTYGFVTGGLIKVELNGSIYTITADLSCENGVTIKGKYVGELTMKDRSYNSTLTADYEVTLTDMPCEIDYYGQYFLDSGIDGDDWIVFIGTEADNTEAIQLELISPNKGFTGGLPVGKYYVQSTYATGDYMCIPGEADGADLYCSWFLGSLSGGIAYAVAPAMEGLVEVTKSGASYTIKFKLYDDAPKSNCFSGSWTGTPSFKNEAVTAVGSMSKKRVQKAPAMKAVVQARSIERIVLPSRISLLK